MGDFADDLSMDYSQEEADDLGYNLDEREVCYCGRLVREDERIFNGKFTVCIYCEHNLKPT